MKNLQIYGLGYEFNDYFFARAAGKIGVKPRLKLTRWWCDILKAAEERKFEGWTDVGIFLLSADYSTQQEIQRRVRKLVKNVRSNWHRDGHENTLTLVTGPKQRQTSIAFYAYKRVSRQHRDATINTIFTRASEEFGCSDVLLIGLSAGVEVYPYQLVALAFGVGEGPDVPASTN